MKKYGMNNDNQDLGAFSKTDAPSFLKKSSIGSKASNNNSIKTLIRPDNEPKSTYKPKIQNDLVNSKKKKKNKKEKKKNQKLNNLQEQTEVNLKPTKKIIITDKGIIINSLEEEVNEVKDINAIKAETENKKMAASKTTIKSTTLDIIKGIDIENITKKKKQNIVEEIEEVESQEYIENKDEDFIEEVKIQKQILAKKKKSSKYKNMSLSEIVAAMISQNKKKKNSNEDNEINEEDIEEIEELEEEVDENSELDVTEEEFLQEENIEDEEDSDDLDDIFIATNIDDIKMDVSFGEAQIVHVRKRQFNFLNLTMIISVILAIVMIVNTVFAIQEKGKKILNFGNGLEIDLDKSNLSISENTSIANASQVLNSTQKLFFTKTSKGIPMVVRFKISFETTSQDANIVKAVQEINSNFYDENIFQTYKTTSKNYGWRYVAGYFYLVNLQNSIPTYELKTVNDTSTYIICDRYTVSVTDWAIPILKNQDISLNFTLQVMSSKMGTDIKDWQANNGVNWKNAIDDYGVIKSGYFGNNEWILIKSKTDAYDKVGTLYSECKSTQGEFYAVSKDVIPNCNLEFDKNKMNYSNSFIRQYLQSQELLDKINCKSNNPYLNAVEKVSLKSLTGENFSALTDRFFILSKQELEGEFREFLLEPYTQQSWWTRTSATQDAQVIVNDTGKDFSVSNKEITNNIRVAFKVIIP